MSNAAKTEMWSVDPNVTETKGLIFNTQSCRLCKNHKSK
jgi:hypothetical protein